MNDPLRDEPLHQERLPHDQRGPQGSDASGRVDDPERRVGDLEGARAGQAPDESGSGATGAGPRSRGRHGGGWWGAVKEIAAIAVTALVISFLIKTFLAQAFWIPSGSMEDTLVYGDRVMVSKIQAGPMSIERGDIVVFEDPGGWLPPVQPVDRGPVLNAARSVLEFVGVAPSTQGNHLIKRIIGMDGDHVVCCDDQGRISVNGQPLDESSYLYPGDEASTVDFDITVPEDHVWLLGDHRSNSRDSRANDDGTGATGSVPMDDVVGQAFVLLFPLSNFTWFGTPDTFDSVPQSTSPEGSAP